MELARCAHEQAWRQALVPGVAFVCVGWRSRGYAPSLWKAARISADVAERFNPSVARPDIMGVVHLGCRCVVHPGENFLVRTRGVNRNSRVSNLFFTSLASILHWACHMDCDKRLLKTVFATSNRRAGCRSKLTVPGGGGGIGITYDFGGQSHGPELRSLGTSDTFEVWNCDCCRGSSPYKLCTAKYDLT